MQKCMVPIYLSLNFPCMHALLNLMLTKFHEKSTSYYLHFTD